MGDGEAMLRYDTASSTDNRSTRTRGLSAAIASPAVQLPALARHHHVEDFLGHLRFKPFGVALLHADHAGDHAVILAAVEHVELGGARTRRRAP